MTLIELGVVMGIVAVLMAMVLGLSRHVTEVVKIRRAQADLGEWHETLNTWYLKYGMYPDPTPFIPSGDVESNLVWLASTNSVAQYRVLNDNNTINTKIPPFSSLASKPLKTSDPWGTPYFYQSATNSYELLSCGPNTQHSYTKNNGQPALFPEGAAASADPNTDDVFFEP